MKNAIHNQKLVTGEQGIDLRNKGQTAFSCPECRGAVRVHAAGGHVPAHFEHLERQGQCKLEHKS